MNTSEREDFLLTRINELEKERDEARRLAKEWRYVAAKLNSIVCEAGLHTAEPKHIRPLEPLLWEGEK